MTKKENFKKQFVRNRITKLKNSFNLEFFMKKLENKIWIIPNWSVPIKFNEVSNMHELMQTKLKFKKH